MARVEICTGGHSIICDSDDDLDVVAALAVDLWRQTRDPKLDRGWGVTGLVIEKADGPYWSGHDGDVAGKREAR